MFETFCSKTLNFAYITIETENIKKIVDEVNPDTFIIPEWRENVFLTDDPEKATEFLFFINTINFSYWPEPGHKKWTVNFNGDNYSGSMALFAAFKKAILAGFPMLEPKYLKEISSDELKIILAGTADIPMFEQRLNILRNIGKNFSENKLDNFIPLIKQANHSALNLIKIIVKIFPSFNDRFIYKADLYNFFKRAQLICAMLYGRYHGKGYGDFTDIDNLTVFADYRVPQTLRKLGLITYNPQLSEKIAAGFYLTEGSPEELEIRISCIKAAELIKNQLNHRFKSLKINSLQLDYFLWHTGKKIAKPGFDFHKTRSIYY